MGHPLRWYLPGVVYEVTSRTIQERLLLLPTERARDLINGVLARALELYPLVFIHAYVFLSNHYHLLCSTGDGAQLAAFFRYVNGNVARKVGRLHGWRGTMWPRRPHVLPVLDDDAVVARLRYLLANGVKEGLVESPRAWPGASAVPGLLGDMVVEGVRVKRGRRGQPPTDERVVVPLTPIPPWAHLSADALRREHEVMIAAIEAEAPPNPVGAASVVACDPHARPAEPAQGPAPSCHASTRSARAWFDANYQLFVDAFRRATAEVAAGAPFRPEHFPTGSFPRPPTYAAPELIHVPWAPPVLDSRPLLAGFS